MSPNSAVPSSRSCNGCRGRSRVGNTNWIAFSEYVRGPQSARSRGPSTLRSNAEAENDDQCPGGNREQTALPDGRRGGSGNPEQGTARCRPDGHQQKKQMGLCG